MDFGTSLRTYKGLFRAVTTAAQLECDSVQIAVTKPTSFDHDPIDVHSLELLSEHIKKLIPGKTIIHAPYTINLASVNDETALKSKNSFLDALERARIIGIDYVISHIGNHQGAGLDVGIKQVQKILAEVFAETDSPSEIVLEMGSGGRTSVGASLEEVAQILDGIPDIAEGIGICIDTAHLWSAGYKIDTPLDVDHFFHDFDRILGLDKLKVIHLNDTLMGLGFNHDRHYDIAKGKIGKKGFEAIVNYEKLPEHIPGIIETPPGDTIIDDERNLKMLRSLVKK